MARAGAGIAECLAGFGDEIPIVGGDVEGQLEEPEAVGVAGFAGGQRVAEGAMIFAPATLVG
ncbi:MAG TPA: hypothetical protein VEG64_04720 [Candidatus Sulfotelmatobacter sp.]|nr:hypothetical protein [Candidatus Sulfotelmatobacter sp.]